MSIRKFIREAAFQLVRRDVAFFLMDHEDDLLRIFHVEMARLDDELPEEKLFIDLKMIPMGEFILRAALHGVYRFLLGDDFEDLVEIKDLPSNL